MCHPRSVCLPHKRVPVRRRHNLEQGYNCRRPATHVTWRKQEEAWRGTHGIKVNRFAVFVVHPRALHDDHTQTRVAVDAQTDDRSKRPNTCILSITVQS